MNFIFFKFNQSKSSRIEGVEQDNFRKIRSYRFIYQIVLIQFEKQKNTHKLDGIWNCVELRQMIRIFQDIPRFFEFEHCPNFSVWQIILHGWVTNKLTNKYAYEQKHKQQGFFLFSSMLWALNYLNAFIINPEIQSKMCIPHHLIHIWIKTPHFDISMNQLYLFWYLFHWSKSHTSIW